MTFGDHSCGKEQLCTGIVKSQDRDRPKSEILFLSHGLDRLFFETPFSDRSISQKSQFGKVSKAALTAIYARRGKVVFQVARWGG